MAITTSKTYYRQGFSPLMPSVTVAPYPYCLHCKARACAPDAATGTRHAPGLYVLGMDCGVILGFGLGFGLGVAGCSTFWVQLRGFAAKIRQASSSGVE